MIKGEKFPGGNDTIEKVSYCYLYSKIYSEPFRSAKPPLEKQTQSKFVFLINIILVMLCSKFNEIRLSGYILYSIALSSISSISI